MAIATSKPPFMMGGGQVYTMGAQQPFDGGSGPNAGQMQATGGYDGSGINPGGGFKPPVSATTPVPTTPVQPPASPTAAPTFNATADNPMAALSTYQPQQKQGSYAAPTFQGSAQFEAGSYGAPTISTPTYQAGNTQAQQISANPASAGQFDVSAFRPFADAVYSEATRQLDPQFQSQEAAFRQRMVNQGIQEGTPAFDAALGNFERSRNDAYSQARNQSLA